MSRNWKKWNREKLSPLTSIFPTDATKWFGGDENPAVRRSMDWEFDPLFGRAQIPVSDNWKGGPGLQRE
jgi:hypothetical protein